jgi:NADH-ubiquinone oxidoreductase chain 4
MSFFWSLLLICSLLFLFLPFTYFSFLIFWAGNLGLLLGCDLISYGLILLSLWICVLWFWPENLFSVQVIFLDFFFLLLLFYYIVLYCTFRRDGLLSFYIYIFWEWIDPYLIFHFGLGISTWAGSAWDLFIVLYFIGFSGVLINTDQILGITWLLKGTQQTHAIHSFN